MGDGARILVVEDDRQLLRAVREMLVTEGYQTSAAQKGQRALEMIQSEKFDLVLLDIKLSDMSDIELCRSIRAGFEGVIVVLTVGDSEEDKVAAFDAGADDYVKKPFEAAELLARIPSHLRRQEGATEFSRDLWRLGDAVIDFTRRTIARQGSEVSLSPKQYALLRYLTNNRGRAISHRTLLQAIWGAEYAEDTNLLQAVVVQLRRKIEPDPSTPRYIVSIPWFGYRLDGPIFEMKMRGHST